MISVEGLTRRFGDTLAVDDLTVDIHDGEVFGLLGPNGAGKTTTVRMLAGLIGVTSGRATVSGVDVTDRSAGPRLRGLVGVLPEEVGLYGDLSAAQTLDFFGRLQHLPANVRAERVDDLLHRLDLWDRRDVPAASLSKGLKQRLALARALVHDPPVVLLDEPTANLDPEVARTVREFLVDLGRRGHTVIINTHRLEEAERICDRVGILRTRLLRVGSPTELRASMTGDRVTVELERVTDAVLEAARAVCGGAVDNGRAAVGRATAGSAVAGSGAGADSAAGPGGGAGSSSDGGSAPLVVSSERSLTVTLPPRTAVPDLVTAIVLAGGRITAVTPGESLEDVYLQIVEERA
ncbi:MAG TPA: ABC transporter ATP-binding protein [Intrasporangium sp.]|nr:ABC transporter ATP-binding protein [Intrasporangium sp.]